MERYNYGIRLSGGYELNDNNNITAGFYYGKRFQIRDANLFYNNLRTDFASGTTSSFDYYNPTGNRKKALLHLPILPMNIHFPKHRISPSPGCMKGPG
jgi:ferric enterobactin receptor